MSENFDEKIYEMIIHSLNEFRDSMKDFKIEIKKDIDRLYDIHSKINEKVIKMELQIKIMWSALGLVAITTIGIVIKGLFKLVIK